MWIFGQWLSSSGVVLVTWPRFKITRSSEISGNQLSGSRNHGWSCRFVGSSSEDTSCREADVCYICRVSKPPTLTWRGSLESRVPQLQGHPRHLTVVQNYEARHQ
ncbi:hypothetical protein TNCV_3744051 [Trichonephila clavipes]|nr:hypothetical protein TNCV_3744051 [Trichonephila clavipes]